MFRSGFQETTEGSGQPRQQKSSRPHQQKLKLLADPEVTVLPCVLTIPSHPTRLAFSLGSGSFEDASVPLSVGIHLHEHPHSLPLLPIRR